MTSVCVRGGFISPVALVHVYMLSLYCVCAFWIRMTR